jgi:hypothetical protein
MLRMFPTPMAGPIWSTPAAPAVPAPSPAVAAPAPAVAQPAGPPTAMSALYGHFADDVAAFEAPRGEAKPKTPEELEALAVQIFEAADGAGTNEKQIFAALSGLDPLEALRLRAVYADHYDGRSLDLELADELDEDDQALAFALMSGNTAAAAAQKLVHAAGENDKAVIFETLRGITDPKERAAVLAEFSARSGGDSLEVMLDDELGGDDLEKGNALLHGNFAYADAVDLDEAIDDEDDEDALVPILERCQTDEQRAAVARAYAFRTGNVLDEELESELDDEDLDLARAVMSGDEIAASAARIRQGETGSGTDEDRIFAELDGDPARTAQVIEYFSNRYGDFTAMVEDELTDVDIQRASFLVQDGELPPEFAIYYAMHGPGTREEMLKQAMKGKSKAEMKGIEARFDRDYAEDGDTLRTELDDELDGRDAHYIGRMVNGEAEGVDEKIDQRLDDWEFERGVGAGGGGAITDLFSDSGEMLDHQKERLLELRERFSAAKTDEERAAIEAEVDKVAGYADADVESFHKAQDVVAEIGALIAGLLATAVTAGSCGPLFAAIAKGLAVAKGVVAAVGTAVAAGSAGMATKELLLGESYAADDQAADFGKMALSAVTGGVAATDKIARFAELGFVQSLAVKTGKGLVENTVETFGNEGMWNGTYDVGDFLGDQWAFIKDTARGSVIEKVTGGVRKLGIDDEELGIVGAAGTGAIDGTSSFLTAKALDGEGITTHELWGAAAEGSVGAYADRALGDAAELEEGETTTLGEAVETAAPEELAQAAASAETETETVAPARGTHAIDVSDPDKTIPGIQYPPELAAAIGNLEGADLDRVVDMRAALHQTEEGKRALAILQTEGVVVTYKRGKGSFQRGNHINIDPNTSADEMAGLLVHEAHHAQTFARDVESATDRDTFVRRALRNEAEAEAGLFEHHLESGADLRRRDPLARVYADERDAAAERFTAWGLDLDPSQMTSLARECGTQEIAPLFAAEIPSTSYVMDAQTQREVLDPTKPQSYLEHYQWMWDQRRP